MKNQTFRAFLAMGALAIGAASGIGATGCVSDRPSRNGVFNENQYLRKSFIVRDADGTKADTGWMLKSTILSASTPNPLANLGFFVGAESGGGLVRFAVTQDKLELLNMRELGPVDAAQASRTPEVVNAWPVTNVDLKYRINLDGEKTNFYEENQELDWQVRQWVKINFAKNDLSDVAPFGQYYTYYLNLCGDLANSAVTLVPSSFTVDETNDYMQWAVQLTVPIKYDDAACVQAYGEPGIDAQRIGRNSVTFNMMYSLTRPEKLTDDSYPVVEIAEKDPILHKYGPFRFNTYTRDPDTGLQATRSLLMRFNPNKDIVWYFAPGYPAEFKGMFNDPGMAVDQTNAILAAAGAKAKVIVKDFDADLPEGQCDIVGADPNKQCPRQYGDLRYSFLRWESDLDTGSPFAGVTQFVTDPRTGETLSASINIAAFAIKDYYVQRVDAYLRSIGAVSADNPDGTWADGPKNCKDGDTIPMVTTVVQNNHNLSSTLYTKMQLTLAKPVETYGPLGPVDFIAQHPATDDFWRAYYAIIPYGVFADPATNAFVTPEGFGGVFGGPAGMMDRYRKEASFQALASQIDRGEDPFQGVTGTSGLKNATDFMNTMKDLTINHRQLEYTKQFTHPYQAFDTIDLVSLEGVMAKDARHCVLNTPGDAASGTHWETKDEWVGNLIHTYWTQTMWHEFGHSLGLEHNFMASVDKPNYPHYKDSTGRDHVSLYASSVMEYNAAADRLFWNPSWGPYDQGALGFIYGNGLTKDNVGPQPIPTGTPAANISGQISKTVPWNDPYGWSDDGATEKQYLFCTHEHLAYTPLCRQGDLGATPSEIISNAIDAYEWQYQWRNFRVYRKYWDDSPYANTPAALVTDMRKFMSLWVFDWNADELSDTFRRIGIVNPDPNGSQLEYYNALENKFNEELSAANSMVAAFHNAVIQQSSGERPYRSIYDKYYGDVTQQGIILDKFFAMQGFVALWPTDNYDVNQAGSYLASYEGLGDSFFNFVAEQTVDTMVGGQYDVFPWFVPSAVAQFAQDTHSPSFGGRVDVRDWIGGHVFFRLQDFLDYFRDIAVQNNLAGCTDIGSCKYDPRAAGISDIHNEFLGPDKRLWAWAYIADRNEWLVVQKERNTASYIIVRDYNNDVVGSQDDGAQPGRAYGLQLPMKYTLDAFDTYN